jgi:6-phosphogluconate dehydrogenase
MQIAMVGLGRMGANIVGRVSDSGERRWTSIAASEEGVSAPLLPAALYRRFASRGSELFTDEALSAQRLAFGSHLEKAAQP